MNIYRQSTYTNNIRDADYKTYYRRRILMNIFDDNRATPKKRTGVKNNINSPAKENDNDNNQAQTIAPEIAQPNPSSATPTIPTEMPARDIK